MTKKIVKILRWIWEFPQCLLGIVLINLYKAQYISTYKKIDFYITDRMKGGISCGIYVILHKELYANKIIFCMNEVILSNLYILDDCISQLLDYIVVYTHYYIVKFVENYRNIYIIEQKNEQIN